MWSRMKLGLTVLFILSLLAGCAGSPADDVAAPETSPEPIASPTAEPTPTFTPTPSPAPDPVSLEEWVDSLPLSAPSYTFASSEPDIEDGINWPEEGVILNLGDWTGTLEEAADLAGITLEELEALNPDLDFSDPQDYYYQLCIREEPYILPQVEVQEVTLVMPWMPSRLQEFSCKVPADLDEQAAGVLAAAYRFLRECHGVHHGMEPSTYHQEGGYYTAAQGALCTSYTQLEEYLDCVFTPEYYQEMLAGPLPEGQVGYSVFYQGADDSICFMSSDRGGNLAHCGTLFTQPEIQPDGSLLFWQLSLHLDLDEFNGYGQGITYTPVAANASRVWLVPTEDGWRVAELTLPY